MQPRQIEECFEQLRASFEAAQVVYRHQNRIVLRLRQPARGGSVIVKMWSRPDLKGRLRRALGIGSCEHEWRSLRRLSAAGVAVPQPFACRRLAPPLAGFTEALLMQDLGECESANQYLRRLIRERRETEVFAFENAMIDMTERILAAGVLDVDHGLVNMVVQAAGRPVRLDLELARYVIWPRAFAGAYGRMLGHLLALHAFAVQPDTTRTARFAQRLRERLRPPARALAAASAYVRLGMRMQLERDGIDTRVALPWDQAAPQR